MELGLDRVILLPNSVQPFKEGRNIASAADRLAMLSLVAAEDRLFTVSTEEILGERISYTYRTLCRIREKSGDDRFWFIMGADSLLSIEQWYSGDELLREFSLAAGLRPGNGIDMEKIDWYRREFGADIHILTNPVLDISSTDIKARVRAGQDISLLVPGCVEKYIYENGLYRK